MIYALCALGIIVFAVFILALCKAASDADDMMGYD